jgi:hypothetical protein
MRYFGAKLSFAHFFSLRQFFQAMIYQAIFIWYIFQDNTKFKKECNLGKALMKHCIRIRTVCGEKIDVFSGPGCHVSFMQNNLKNTERTDRARSETQVIANHPMRVHPLLEEDISRQMSSNRDKNLQKLKKHVSRIDALRMAFSSEKVDRWSAVDLELVSAVEVVQDGGPYQVWK